MMVSAKIFPLLPCQPNVSRILDPHICWPQHPDEFETQIQPKAIEPAKIAETSIYVVDDDEALIDLYTSFLTSSGYQVRSFSDRTRALAALIVDKNPPGLLIMDHRGHRMASDYFIRCCLVAHPTLRILMASGLNAGEFHFSSDKPDRFIQKPFTLQELLREVEATLKA